MRNRISAILAPMLFGLFATGGAFAADKPNIVVMWGDDTGMTNVSAYGQGVVGYKTLNIDRIADEGALFTDYYTENSCTAGRAAFIQGQSVFRTGNSKVAFMEQMSPGTYDVWTNEFRNLRIPLTYNLRADPFEFAPITSNSWWEGQMKNTFYLYPALTIASEFLGTFKEFPPRHEAASVTMTGAMDKIRASGGK